MERITITLYMRSDKLKKLIIILCLLWMGFIFYNSSKVAVVSSNESMKVTNFVLKQDVFKVGTETKDKVDNIIRKNAHAFEYIVLAVLVGIILFSSSMKGKGAIIYILFICLFYAVLDEYHQSFVQGRGSLVGDVLIDFSGSLIGVLIYYLFYYGVYQTHWKKHNANKYIKLR
jgi:VanZ family protein